MNNTGQISSEVRTLTKKNFNKHAAHSFCYRLHIVYSICFAHVSKMAENSEETVEATNLVKKKNAKSIVWAKRRQEWKCIKGTRRPSCLSHLQQERPL